jgi:hypothetical protein
MLVPTHLARDQAGLRQAIAAEKDEWGSQEGY